MSNILLKHLLLKTAGNVGGAALNAATQARAEKASAAGPVSGLGKRRGAPPCTPCAARSLVHSVQKKVLG